MKVCNQVPRCDAVVFESSDFEEPTSSFRKMLQRMTKTSLTLK